MKVFKNLIVCQTILATFLIDNINTSIILEVEIISIINRNLNQKISFLKNMVQLQESLMIILSYIKVAYMIFEISFFFLIFIQ